MYMTLLAPTLFSALVAGHGHITNIVINGVSFGGWDINSYPYTDSPPTVVAWGTPNTANGFISPGKYAIAPSQLPCIAWDLTVEPFSDQNT
jgi:endoglucanase